MAMASITRVISSARLACRGRLLSTADCYAAVVTISTSSPIATTSKVTLSTSGSSHQPVFTSPRRMLTTVGSNWRRDSSAIIVVRAPGSRGMATLTRQPESPEEPEVFSGSEPPSIILTDRAVQHLAKVSTREKNPELALRISVEPGGCHGYQYKMEMTKEVEDDDFRFSSGDNVHLLIDSTSLRLIKGSTIDYVTELIGSQFAILNNPQAKGAGCGCGVSWEPNF